MANTDEISEAQRRRIAAEERRGKTYMGHAMAELDDAGGRYATVTKKVVTGAAPGSAFPQLPDDNPWHSEPIGPEPFVDGRSEGNTLNYEIDRPDVVCVEPASVIAPARKFPRRA